MKFRIKQKGDKFYPQKKSFIFWTHFPGKEYKYKILWPTFFDDEDYGVGYENLYFNTLEEAQKYMEIVKNDNKITYHKI